MQAEEIRKVKKNMMKRNWWMSINLLRNKRMKMIIHRIMMKEEKSMRRKITKFKRNMPEWK